MNMFRQQLSQSDNIVFMISVGSRAKGSLFNVCQMTGLLGQQYINGKRLTGGIPQGAILTRDLLLGHLDLD